MAPPGKYGRAASAAFEREMTRASLWSRWGTLPTDDALKR